MESRSDYINPRRVTGRVDTIGAHAVFGSVIGLVALTLGGAALGAASGRDLGETAAYGCTIAGCVVLCLTGPAARRSEVLAITALFAAGLLVGLGPILAWYLAFQPETVWHAAAATGLFLSALGATGHAIGRDLSAARRGLSVALAATLANVFLHVLGLIGSDRDS